ncbi:HTH_Tnp_Tc3_2 domain-containing protein [Trichonephila clavipes]|nr:HTH_Tnp_Tc3_2 domain-containing protein [Trichonephila clavipes]
MQRYCALRIAGRGRSTSFSVEYKTGNQSLFECAESFTKQGLRGVGTSGCERCHLHERPATERLPQANRREHRNIRNARVQPTASSATIQAQVAPSLRAPVASRAIRRRLAEGHLGLRRALRMLPLTTTPRGFRLEWCRARQD